MIQFTVVLCNVLLFTMAPVHAERFVEGAVLPLASSEHSSDHGVRSIPEHILHTVNKQRKEAESLTTRGDTVKPQISTEDPLFSTESKRNPEESSPVGIYTDERTSPNAYTTYESNSSKNRKESLEIDSSGDPSGSKDLKAEEDIDTSDTTTKESDAASMRNASLRRQKRQDEYRTDGNRHAVEGRMLSMVKDVRGRFRPFQKGISKRGM